jgi:polysaccharide export outer membrane protein
MAIAISSTTGCAHGPYVWVDDLSSDVAGSTDYVIATGDTLSVRVFNQEAMSTRARVRGDGKISIPFLGDVLVRGKPPAGLAREIEAGLKNTLVSPTVTVTVDEFQQPQITVIGEVAHPGVFPIEASASVLRALALAGGLTDYASRDNIYVLRSSPPPRIRFTFRSLLDNQGRAAMFRLRAGDTVVVE